MPGICETLFSDNNLLEKHVLTPEKGAADDTGASDHNAYRTYRGCAFQGIVQKIKV